MANPSFNSLSVLSKPRQEQLDTLDSTTVHHQTLTASHPKDWHYGTEELLDALPRVWTRSLLYLIIGFAGIILPWSMLSKVDETGTARGRIEPKGATQRLDAAVGGNVIAVKVKEGEQVRAGQILVEQESDILRTNVQASQTKLQGDKNQLAQLQLLKNQLMLAVNVTEQQNQAQQLEKRAQVQQAQQNLDTLKTGYNLQKEEKLAKVNQMRQALDSSLAAYKLAEVRLKSAQEKVPRYRKVWNEGAISHDRFLEVEQLAQENYQQLVQAQSNISQAQSNLKEQQTNYQRTIHQAESDIQQAQLRLTEQENNYQSVVQAGKLTLLKSQQQLKDLLSQITVLQSEVGQIKSQIQSFNLQLAQRVVRSPIDGTIFQLPIQQPGAVVQPGQMIAQVAPKGSTLILKAQMTSQQSGFLRAGMPVKIKFDAYPFQDYGVVQGRVSWISPDSKVSETNSGKLETYELDIALQQPYIPTANKRIELTPGQTATAEVIVRQRRVIDFLLDPFKKLQKGGLDL
ncbi:HlyD family type I secretion periplasmic adaptor subunit [Scytonema sp. NUACC21]